MKRAAIGIFDSGIGGLTVASEVVRQLPHEDVVYLGDTARLPYGTKSAATVCRYAERATELLLRYPIKAVVVACNTASTYALHWDGRDARGRDLASGVYLYRLRTSSPAKTNKLTLLR